MSDRHLRLTLCLPPVPLAILAESKAILSFIQIIIRSLFNHSDSFSVNGSVQVTATGTLKAASDSAHFLSSLHWNNISLLQSRGKRTTTACFKKIQKAYTWTLQSKLYLVVLSCLERVRLACPLQLVVSCALTIQACESSPPLHRHVMDVGPWQKFAPGMVHGVHMHACAVYMSHRDPWTSIGIAIHQH